MICALVQENVVVDVQDLTDDQIAAIGKQYSMIIDLTGMNPQPIKGWTFDGATLHDPNSNTPANMKITTLAFRDRFTFAELVAIKTATNTTVNLQVLADNLAAATYIDLSRADTIAGVGLLVTYGLITSQRATAILTTVPTAMELYLGATL